MVQSIAINIYTFYSSNGGRLLTKASQLKVAPTTCCKTLHYTINIQLFIHIYPSCLNAIYN